MQCMFVWPLGWRWRGEANRGERGYLQSPGTFHPIMLLHVLLPLCKSLPTPMKYQLKKCGAENLFDLIYSIVSRVVSQFIRYSPLCSSVAFNMLLELFCWQSFVALPGNVND